MEAIRHDKKSVDGGVEIVTVPEVGRYQFRRIGLAELKPLLLMLFE